MIVAAISVVAVTLGSFLQVSVSGATIVFHSNTGSAYTLRVGGQKAHFTTSYPIYTPGELYGGLNPNAVCYTCVAANVTGSAPPSQSLNGGSGVDPLTGDFSTSIDIFKGSGLNDSMGLSLNYDAYLAQEQVASKYVGSLNSFGNGWTSTYGASISGAAGSQVTVRQANGSQVTFNLSAGEGGSTSCPSGDYPTTNKYTMPNSSYQWCALASVHAELESVGTGATIYYENGGQLEQTFYWDGTLASQNPVPDDGTDSFNVREQVLPGSYVTGYPYSCPSTAYLCTLINSRSGSREILEVLNSSDEVIEVVDPSGVTYTFSYDSHHNLTQVEKYANQSTPSTWNLVYDTSQLSPYTGDLIQLYDPDSGVGVSPMFSAGAAHSLAIQFNHSGSDIGMVSSLTDGTGASTSYAYTDACSNGQCVGVNALQKSTITYPAQAPCPACAAIAPIQVDTYVSGVESSTTLGSSSNPYESEKWSYDWSFGYGDSNSTETVTYPNALTGSPTTAVITLDPAGNIIQTKDAFGNYATSYYNDSGGNNFPELIWSFPGYEPLPLSSSPPSNAESYTYNSYGQETTATDPLGNVTSYGYYSGSQKLCYEAPPTITVTSPPPTCSGNGISSPGTVAPIGSTAFAYDSYGDVVAEYKDYLDTASGSDPQTTTAKYDVMGDLLWSIPATGQSGSQSPSNPFATVVSYTPSNLPATVTPPGQGTTIITYDAALNAVMSVSPAATTTTVYDADNRVCYQVTESSSPAGLSCTPSTNLAGSRTFTYVPGSTNVATSTDAKGNITGYYYGDLAYPNLPTEVIDPGSSAIQYSAYNDYGDVCVSGDVSLASQQGTASQCNSVVGDTSMAVNALGNETSITDPSGNTTTNAFTDAAYPTLKTSSTNALGAMTSYSYDADGNVVKATNPDATSITTSYDADSRVCTQSDNGTTYGCGAGTGVSGVVNYTYNGASDRTSMVSYSPTAATTTYSYTNGKLNSTTDSNSKTVGYVYNYVGQVACQTYPVDITTGCGTFTSPATASSTNTIVTKTYDTAGRLSTTSDWLGNTTYYTYADAWSPGTPTKITYPTSSGVTANYGLDNNSQVTSLTAGTTGSTPINDTWTFDSNRRNSATTMNGSTSGTVGYNANSQITAATNLATSTSNDVYTVAANGQITKDAAPSGPTTSYSYNAGGELCSGTAGSSSTACGTNPSTGTSYSYTTNGQRASASPYTSSVEGTPTTYAWNPYGELCNVSSTTTACGSTPTSGASYTYNGDGLRMTTTSNGGTSTTSAIFAVGTLAQAEGTGISALSVSPVNVGDAFVLAAKVKDASVTISSVSGGGATWSKLTNAGSNPDVELWLGTITTPGSSTITVTYSGSVTSDTIELDAQEYTNGTGSSTTWSQDVVGSSNNTSSSTSVTFPTLTPSASHELYVGFARMDNTGSAGSTSGFTYDVTSPNNNLYIYNPNVSSAVSPTGTQSPAGTSIAVGALISASGTMTSGTTIDSTWDGVSGGSLPLNINDAATSSGVTTNTSYLYGDLLFGGTAPVEQIVTTSSGSMAIFLVSNQTGVQGVFSSSGSLDELSLYSPYGTQAIVSGSRVTPFGFQGSYTDSTGLIYLINRYYDPLTDQFISIDPMVAKTNQAYAFVNDNPLNWSDPMGLRLAGMGTESCGGTRARIVCTGASPSGESVLGRITTTTAQSTIIFGAGEVKVSTSVTLTTPGSSNSPSVTIDKTGSVTVKSPGYASVHASSSGAVGAALGNNSGASVSVGTDGFTFTDSIPSASIGSSNVSGSISANLSVREGDPAPSGGGIDWLPITVTAGVTAAKMLSCYLTDGTTCIFVGVGI